MCCWCTQFSQKAMYRGNGASHSFKKLCDDGETTPESNAKKFGKHFVFHDTTYIQVYWFFIQMQKQYTIKDNAA